ncbi:MAG: YdeI/OmpD-associated family protein [Saprospiraceae bacterium]|nr:YdeI/OmpD-associated family protein [Saprospiraceae bacterium]
MTWSESVDQALCFGWIDGVRRSIDNKSYCIRFTPRKPTSIWSAINIKKIEDLTQKGLIHPVGLAIFQKRKEHKSGIYSHENETRTLSPEFEKKFKANKKAWDFFNAQAPSYQKVMFHWIMTAKQESTRMTRPDKTITESQAQKRMQ